MLNSVLYQDYIEFGQLWRQLLTAQGYQLSKKSVYSLYMLVMIRKLDKNAIYYKVSNNNNTIRYYFALTHCGLVTPYGVNTLVGICWSNGLSPLWCQAITWTCADLLSLGQTSVNFFYQNTKHFFEKQCIWKHALQNGGHFAQASMC